MAARSLGHGEPPYFTARWPSMLMMPWIAMPAFIINGFRFWGSVSASSILLLNISFYRALHAHGRNAMIVLHIGSFRADVS